MFGHRRWSMIRPNRIHSLFLFVTNLANSSWFYRAVLGSSPAHEDDNIAIFPIGNSEIMLHLDANGIKESIPGSWNSRFTLHLEVNGIQQFWNELKSHGIDLKEIPTRKPYGVIEFGVIDPDGYQIEFVELTKE
jgi:catechol 2,3-dioxygenase-like lactoylglutathione lyase family enzyme